MKPTTRTAIYLAFAALAGATAYADDGFSASSCSSFNSACTSACNDAQSLVTRNTCTNVIGSCQCAWSNSGLGQGSCNTLKEVCEKSCQGKQTFSCDPVSMTTICQCTGENLDYRTNEKCKTFVDKCLSDTCKGKIAATAYCTDAESDSKCICEDTPALPSHNGTAKPKGSASKQMTSVTVLTLGVVIGSLAAIF